MIYFSKPENTKELLQPGAYVCTLHSVEAVLRPSKFRPEGQPKLIFNWAVDGTQIQVSDWLNITRNFVWDGRAELYKRLGQIVGQRITTDNIHLLGISFVSIHSDNITSYDDLMHRLAQVDANGKPVKVFVEALAFNNAPLIGCQRMIGVSNGKNAQGDDINLVDSVSQMPQMPQGMQPVAQPQPQMQPQAQPMQAQPVQPQAPHFRSSDEFFTGAQPMPNDNLPWEG